MGDAQACGEPPGGLERLYGVRHEILTGESDLDVHGWERFSWTIIHFACGKARTFAVVAAIQGDDIQARIADSETFTLSTGVTAWPVPAFWR
jgi:hypothetical protein